MSASMRASSAPGSSRPVREPDTTVEELNFKIPAKSGKTRPPPVSNHFIPDELLGYGIRRPDAVWHHLLGRNKYQFFLEQPTSMTGAGRDISFLCDAMVNQKKTAPLPPLTDRRGIGDTKNLSVSDSLIPEEYRIVKNKGLPRLSFFEDAFTVQLQDEEQKLRVFPSLRPSGRREVVQLMRVMDDMLEKAGVDQQSEELTELSQMEGLLQLVQVEQNIYNIVFHEVIRQVSVGCAERGQLLAKVRQRYQSLLERIPRRLKALHTEVVVQRAVDRRLTEEIYRIKASIQELNTELCRIKDHDAFVSQQAERTHRQLAGAIEQTDTNSDVVQGYHELYDLQRTRLEAQLLHMTEERDCWKQVTFCIALKVISLKKLQMINRLHIIEQSWFKTAEHCSLYLTHKDTEDLNTIMELGDYWKQQLTAFMSRLRSTEHAQCEQISAIQQGIAKWLAFFPTQNKCPYQKYEKVSLDKIHADVAHWSNTLALQCDLYQGEEMLQRQQMLSELGSVQEKWLNTSLELFTRHPPLNGELHEGQESLRGLNGVLSELFKQLDAQSSGEIGIHAQIMPLLGLMESWVSKLGAVIGRPEMMSVSEWCKLEEALCNWQSLAEKVSPNISSMDTENDKDQNKPDVYEETEKALDKVQEFITRLSSFIDGENQILREEVTSLHKAKSRWMLDLLLFMVPDCEDHTQGQEPCYITNISLQTLDEDAKMLDKKLHLFSAYISRSCKLILEEQILQKPHEYDSENEMNECRKLQRECIDWVETCNILLSGVKARPVCQAEPASTSDVPVSPAGGSMESLVNKEVPAEPTADSEVKDETEAEHREGALVVHESPVVKLISYDGTITERMLGQRKVHLNGTKALVVSPVTDDTQKAFSELTTVGLLQQELHDSELQLQSTERRALKAEEALQAALERIQDLERQLQGRASLEHKASKEENNTPPPSPPPVTTPAPPMKTTSKPTSTKKTKKR